MQLRQRKTHMATVMQEEQVALLTLSASAAALGTEVKE
jgi:hypothetical protein